MTHVKGTGIRAVTEFLKGRYGDAGLEKIRQALTPEDQAIFKKPVMPLSWVDFNYYMRMIVIADKLLGKGDFEVVDEAARFNMRANFRGMYKIFISLLTPKVAIKGAKTIWRQFFDAGEVRDTWLGEKRADLKLTEFPNMPLHHEYNLTPSIDEIIRISGGKNTQCRHVKCLLKGDGCCLWEIEWE